MSHLPFVAVNVAMTADGKLAPDHRHFKPFSTKHDRDLMMLLRSRADAVMSGASTVADGAVDLGPGGKRYQKLRIENGLSEFNLRVIVSRTGSISPNAHIFKTRFSPILILTTEATPPKRLRQLAKVSDDLFIDKGSSLDLRSALQWLRDKWNVKRLLCEGGGELNGAMFSKNLVQELYLTICPVIFGGRHAPTPADGDGIDKLTQAIPMQLKSLERHGEELYCVFKVRRRTPTG